MPLEIAAFVVFAILIVAAVVIIVDLGGLPGKIAHRRGHPQAEAVTVAGWIGLVTGILWPLAFVWAFICYPGAGSPAVAEPAAAPANRLAAIESRLAVLESEAVEQPTKANGDRS